MVLIDAPDAEGPDSVVERHADEYKKSSEHVKVVHVPPFKKLFEA